MEFRAETITYPKAKRRENFQLSKNICFAEKNVIETIKK